MNTDKAAIEALEEKIRNRCFTSGTILQMEAVIAIAKRAIDEPVTREEIAQRTIDRVKRFDPSTVEEPEKPVESASPFQRPFTNPRSGMGIRKDNCKPVEQWPKWYVRIEPTLSFRGKKIAYSRRDSETSGETFHIDGTSYKWSDNVPDGWVEVTEEAAKTRLTQVESPDDWVEITDPKHIRRRCDQCRKERNLAIGGWVDCFESVGRSQEDYPNTRIRCRRKDLPVPIEPYDEWVDPSMIEEPVKEPATRTIVFRQWIVWQNGGAEHIVWWPDGFDLRYWQHTHDTGETKTFKVPV